MILWAFLIQLTNKPNANEDTAKVKAGYQSPAVL